MSSYEKREGQRYGVESIMSKKRFTWKTEKLQHLNDEVLMIVDNANKEWKGHILNIVDLLNKQQATIQFLQNEIDELKKDIDIYKYEEKKHSETARKLYEENEQLKQEHKIAIDEMITDYKNLEKENEQLKGLIKKTLETTPIEHNLAVALKNSVREFYE